MNEQAKAMCTWWSVRGDIMKKLIMLTALLGGCAIDPPTATKTICPDGSPCVVVDCTGVSYSHSDCVIAFGKSCPKGYSIVENMGGNYLIKCSGQW